MRRLASLVCLALMLIAGCSQTPDEPVASDSPSASSTPSSATAPSPPPPLPRPRACYRLTLAEAVAPTNNSTPVPCRGRWTSSTFHVGSLDLVTVDGHLLAVDSAEANSQVAEECPQRLARHLGGTAADLRLTVFRAIWFTPTLEEASAGAEWFRCDAVALAKPGRLARLTDSVRNILDRDYSDYGLCGTARPGESAFQRVSCAQPHTWVALSSVDLPGQDYPGRGRVSSLGVSPCTEAAREVADDALDFEWGYEWPTAAQWNGAANQPPQRYGVCWAPADGS